MSGFSGEYECKVDGKGRLMMPTKIVKQLPSGASDRLMLNGGFEKCLTLYAEEGWKKFELDIATLNDYEPDHRKLIRLLTNGATEVSLDSTNRLMIPKRLVAKAGIKKEVIVIGMFDKIELWDKATYDAEMAVSLEEKSRLAKKYLGSKSSDNESNET